VDPATISRAFSELIENGLMEKRNQEYKVLNDLDNTSFANIEGYPEFIQINNNFFMDFIQRLNAKNENKDRSLIKAVEVFYYLITKNRHVMVDSLVLSSGETAKSINKNLHHDGNYIKNYLELLETVGQIEIDDEGKIKTIYGCGTCQPIKKNNVYDINRFSKFSEEKEINQDDLESIPEDCESDLIPTDESEDSKPESITDREKIDLILVISEGDKEQTERLLKQYKISDESLKAYSESCNSN
jgi:hypothetical protein